LKILVLNQFASTPSYSTGAGERFFYLASQFGLDKHETHIVSGGYNHLFLELPVTPNLFNEEKVSGGKFTWVKMRRYEGESFLGRFYSWFEFLFKLYRLKISEKPDVVIVSSMSIFPIFYALRLKRKQQVKVILEVRDIWPLTPIELGGYSRNHPFIKMMLWVEKFAYRKADQIVSVLPGFERHVKNVLDFDKPVEWIPNACHPVEKDQKDSHPFIDKAFFNVIYTGAIGIANAMEYVVEAAKLLNESKKIRFVIVGEGPEKDKLIAMSHGLSNVIFTKKVAKDEVNDVLKNADASIISWRDKSLYKFGVSANKYNDYMLASRPIISASNIPDDPVLLSGGGVQAKAEDSKSIAKAILEVYHMSEQERNEMGAKGRAFVLENQTYSGIAGKYLDLIEKLVTRT
jgi:glycosyltransferase involved in cell wall biosynthesis